jgi:hypothetical protein
VTEPVALQRDLQSNSEFAQGKRLTLPSSSILEQDRDMLAEDFILVNPCSLPALPASHIIVLAMVKS